MLDMISQRETENYLSLCKYSLYVTKIFNIEFNLFQFLNCSVFEHTVGRRVSGKQMLRFFLLNLDSQYI